MHERFLTLDYLGQGTLRQRAAAAALAKLGVFERLAPFGPLLAGTIPLDVDLPGSDLDVLCEAHDPDAFVAAARAGFGQCDGFSHHRAEHQGLPAAIVRFQAEGFAVELFGQPLPAAQQQAFLHLVAEARLLAAGGSDDREAIRALKLEGLNTEPAFGERFMLTGDPYVTLRQLAAAPDGEIAAIVARAAAIRRECVFCRIVAGAAPASVIARAEAALAFLDLDQAAPGHTLVIPRRHVETIDGLDDGLAAGLMQTAVRVVRALNTALSPAGLNLTQANGRAAGQEVPHVHLHLIPRGVPKRAYGTGRAALDALAERICAALETQAPELPPGR
ncbi:MAG TPA: DUF4269 domain-containing protein [Dehalococcoidia bacterium]|nr:DUF4269 domain-containing protein [Dehalococcoidia bacterium]